MIGNDFRVFIDFEHNGLQHATWKEPIEDERSSIKAEVPIEESPWFNLNNKQQSLNDRYLIRQELHRYFKSRIERDYLFQLDRSPYPKEVMYVVMVATNLDNKSNTFLGYEPLIF